MLNTASLIHVLCEHEVNFFTGVPDSVLESFCSYLDINMDTSQHIITPNEGSAVALATGHYLSTGNVPVVYMQNSGLGNAVNPLTSLTNDYVSRIPILLMIGWRGFPGEKDEPQHKLMGTIMTQLLELMNIRYETLSPDLPVAREQIRCLLDMAVTYSTPVALLTTKNTFEPFRKSIQEEYTLYREDAIRILLDELKESVIVSTTGKCSREVFEFRQKSGQSHGQDYYNIGSMGHASMIALGIAKNNPERVVCCLDGDGALLMHLGALANIGQMQPRNFIHIILNNGAHDSVGGQRTLALDINVPAIARSCGYKHVYSASGESDIIRAVRGIQAHRELSLLEIKIVNGVRKEPIRPDIAPHILKDQFMEYLRETNHSTVQQLPL